MGTTYQDLLDGVANYYGSGSDQWAQIARYGVTEQTLPIIEQVPGVTVTLSNSGKYLGYDYSNPFANAINPASAIDSNVQSGSYGTGSFNAQLPANAVTDPSTGTTTLESGARTLSAGATVATIADRVSLAIAGVSIGSKLGKLIDSGIYALNPTWWDDHFPTINPQTWDDIASTQGGKSFIRSLFGIENDDATMYIDERLLAYTYMTLLENGAYSSQDTSYEVDSEIFDTLPQSQYFSQPITSCAIDTIGFRLAFFKFEILSSTAPVYAFCFGTSALDTGEYNKGLCFCSTESFSLQRYQRTNTEGAQWSESGTYNSTRYGVLGNPVHMYTTGLFYRNVSGVVNIITSNYFSAINTSQSYIILYGTSSTPSLPGISDNPEASEYINPNTLINPTTGQPVTASDDPADVLQALQNQYPDLFNGAVYEDIPQPDGTTQRITYIPTPYPNTTNPTQPITDTTPGVNPQTNPQVNPNTRTQQLLQQLTDTLTQPPTSPDTGNGDTPPVVIPPGTANALYSIYNPSQGELNSFGAWLWSSNFVDQLLKLFNDPMQAIIGLHKVFAQPSISGTDTIKVGYLDSGVSSNVVGAQYTTIDCGEIPIYEYFGNVFDYDPFTNIYIYLPFIGIEKLDTGDVMRGIVHVVYHVDVLNGACLAEVRVTRDGSGGTLYTYTGNCAVQYPISSGSYMGIVASMASVAGGVVGTIASGGALAPVAMGAVNGILNAHSRVQHSGGFSGNAGAMGCKIPYIIITRPQTSLANNFPLFVGVPANETTILSSCSGFIKINSCHVHGIPATDDELTEIETLLKTGVII